MNKTKCFPAKAVLSLALIVANGVAQAQFSYNSGQGQYGDVLICFHPVSGSYDLVVDAGSVATFTNLTAGQKITIRPTYYTGANLSFVGTNNIYWSAFACQRLTTTKNIWVTRPRASLNSQSTPWTCQSSATQGTSASKIDTIGADAVNVATLSGNPNGSCPSSGNTFVVEPQGGTTGSGSSFNSYSYLMTSAGNLGGTFIGDVGGSSLEQTTPANFTTAGQPVRADFYQMLSVSNGLPAKYLGYFEFSTNGVLVYIAGPSPATLTQPLIVSIKRIVKTNTISFTTVATGTYTLRYTNGAGLNAAKTNWPAISSVAGNGLTNSLTDITTNSPRFYVITAQ